MGRSIDITVLENWQKAIYRRMNDVAEMEYTPLRDHMETCKLDFIIHFCILSITSCSIIADAEC